MSQHQYVTGFLQEPTVAVNILTNGSGVSQSLAIWDVTAVANMAWNAAGAVGQHVTLTINGVVVCIVDHAVFSTNHDTATPYWNLGGQQFPFPNGSSVAINAPAGPTFWRVSFGVVYDVVTGS